MTPHKSDNVALFIIAWIVFGAVGLIMGQTALIAFVGAIVLFKSSLATL